MKSCAIAGLVVGLPLAALWSCRTDTTRPDVPPVTSAIPLGSTPVMSDRPPADAGPEPSATSTVEAGVGDLLPGTLQREAPKAAFVELPSTIDLPMCGRTLVAIVKGSAKAKPVDKEQSLATGDVLVVTLSGKLELKGSGTAVVASAEFPGNPCLAGGGRGDAKAPPSDAIVQVVRGNATPKLVWAGGKMSAQLDVPTKVSPEIYLGRLEGTAAVPEHNHPTSWEVIASLDAAGTFTLDGKEQRLGPKQIVTVPPAVKHSWKPDAGSKLVAIQIYSPPGPEQRFVALAAAEKDAGKP